MKIIPAKEKYAKTVAAELAKEFGYSSTMAVPRIQKVVVNVGIGKITKEGEKVDEVMESLTAITGQRPVKTMAHRAIAGFKVRQGMEVGVKVTLRGERMWNFIDRVINSTLPRTRDFQGIDPKAVDGSGNLNIGIREHLIFPEISPERVKHIFGMQVTVVSSATSRKEGISLYRKLGFPLKEEK